jgi:hypothetical protein
LKTSFPRLQCRPQARVLSMAQAAGRSQTMLEDALSFSVQQMAMIEKNVDPRWIL